MPPERPPPRSGSADAARPLDPAQAPAPFSSSSGVFSLMRLVEGEKLTLLIERLMQDGTAKELYRSDLVELIRMHPYTRIQSELDRQDVYEIEISLIDDLDGDTDTYMQTAVTVSGWTIILQDTEM